MNRVLASMYLTAMIASSLSQVAATQHILAAGINPGIAEATVTKVASHMHAVSMAVTKRVQFSGNAAIGSPILTDAELQRLECFAAKQAVVHIPIDIAKFFQIGDHALLAKGISANTTIGGHIFYFSQESKDIVLKYKTPSANYFFLTDSSRLLRAAVVVDGTGTISKLPASNAAQSYDVQLQTWKEAAATLPALTASNG